MIVVLLFSEKIEAQVGEIIADTTIVKNTVSEDQKVKEFYINEDTSKQIRIGNFSINVSKKEDNRRYKKDKSRRVVYYKFQGHWASFQIGTNGFANSDYSMYSDMSKDLPANFMTPELRYSREINVNLPELNVSLDKNCRFGMVTGMGITWNNYRFDNPISIDKNDDGIIYPFRVGKYYRKSKLTLTYITVPLLFEYVFPINYGRAKMFVNAGVVGEVNIGSHTKIKTDEDKTKDRGSFAIEPFKLSGMVQFGGNQMWIYAKYGLTNVFKHGSGPELTPFSVGVCFLNFWDFGTFSW